MELGVGSRELGIGSWELGVRSREIGVGSRELGAGSREIFGPSTQWVLVGGLSISSTFVILNSSFEIPTSTDIEYRKHGMVGLHTAN